VKAYFAANAGSDGNLMLRTPEQAFGERLHTYTIVAVINNSNVLPFWKRKNCNLIVATIFSFSANAKVPENLLSDEDFSVENLDQTTEIFRISYKLQCFQRLSA
jgi:type I site-specific restriction-modification system R (restriction) subunit